MTTLTKIKLKKVATHIPEKLLSEAARLSGLNQTQTIIAALNELVAAKKRDLLLSMKGSLEMKVDLHKSRDRKKVLN